MYNADPVSVFHIQLWSYIVLYWIESYFIFLCTLLNEDHFKEIVACILFSGCCNNAQYGVQHSLCKLCPEVKTHAPAPVNLSG